MTTLELPERPRILVITLRRLGDVLLTTPLIRTIRRGFPQATLDMLVFRDTEDILRGNPDIDNVVSMSARPSAGETLALVAARRRTGLVPHAGETGAWWKRHAHHIAVAAEPDGHRVTQLLGLATALGLGHAPDIVCPQNGIAGEFAPRTPYAVMHPNPFYRYKSWTEAGWR